MKLRLKILIIGLFLIGCKVKTTTKTETQEIPTQQQEKINHLKAFTKAYGYVKYFHPSDEASKIDWNNFSAYGASKILKSNNKQEVIKTLNDLFQPMAPGVVFSDTKQEYDISKITSNDLIGGSTYWQHLGVSKDMVYQGEAYKSVRVNRYTEVNESHGFGSLSLTLDAEKYEGKKIKYTGWVKLKEGSKGTGHLWMRVDKSDKTYGFFNNMEDAPIKSNEWQQYEIIGEVGELGSKLHIGSFLLDKGTLFLDDVHLYYKEDNEWIEIPIKNGDFEAATIGKRNEQSDWEGNSIGYSYSLSTSESKEGKQSAVIAYEGKVTRIEGKPLFDSHPQFGELIEEEIGDGIYCQIPLSLYTSEEYTYPRSNNFETFKNKVDTIDRSPNNIFVYLGNVINTYNVFQHFYPYFDEVDVNWDKELTTALERSFKDQTAYDHLVTLQKFTAPLKDGHIFVNGNNNKEYIPPIYWEWIEGKLIISKVKDETLGLRIGDEITKINGQTSEEYFNEINTRISAGTIGRLNLMAEFLSLFGEKDDTLTLEVNGEKIYLKYDKEYDSEDTKIAIQENDYKLLADNIYYLNLDKIEMNTITSLLPQLEKANGIICDLRGYPNDNHGFIAHLLKEKDTSNAWMRTPKIIYPDQKNILGYDDAGWELEPREPYLGNKKVVFIIDGHAISYAESYMSFIKHYDLATIVGQPTAGTNGNINPFVLLGNYSISWTGMKVVKHDGSQFHGMGILPDIYVEKTIEGIKTGKDEFLEKAIEIILEQ